MTETGTPTKDDLLNGVEAERVWWNAVIDTANASGELSGDEMVDDAWTLRDLIAHLNGWRSWTLLRLESAADGAGAPVPPWPEGMRSDTEEGTDQINAWFLERSRRQSLDDALHETNEQFDRLRTVVDRLSPDDLLTPGRFVDVDPNLANLPIGPAVVGGSFHHMHEEHGPAWQAWLARRLGHEPALPPAPAYEFD